jgi:hypothetical protein
VIAGAGCRLRLITEHGRDGGDPAGADRGGLPEDAGTTGLDLRALRGALSCVAEVVLTPEPRSVRRCRHYEFPGVAGHVMMAIGLIVIVGAIVMMQIADDAMPWLVVGFLALVGLAAVALKRT